MHGRRRYPDDLLAHVCRLRRSRLLLAIDITRSGLRVTEDGTTAVLIAFGADPTDTQWHRAVPLYTHVMDIPAERPGPSLLGPLSEE